ILPLQFFPCHALLQLGRMKRHTLIRDHPKCTGVAFGSTAREKTARRATGAGRDRPDSGIEPMVPVATCCEPTFRGTDVTEYWIGLPHQSALMLAARITLPHFSVSSTMNIPSSAGERGTSSSPDRQAAPVSWRP